MTKMIIEQTDAYPKRMRFDPETRTFRPLEALALLTLRGFKGAYGWVCGCGEPPSDHLDIYLATGETHELGDEVAVVPVGCFIRADGDHKIFAIESTRLERDLGELPIEELSMMKALYPRVGAGEGWFGVEKARELIDAFETRTKSPPRGDLRT